ncbi:MAG TPA: hypothetical protein VFU47_09785 [Armatimonadota bacterium]|nr:hypothetical protein [Armatimonadota bacterium]
MVIRAILLLACAGGGVWGAFRVLEMLAHQAGAKELTYNAEAVPLLIPVGMLGAILGAFIGGILIPSPRR